MGVFVDNFYRNQKSGSDLTRAIACFILATALAACGPNTTGGSGALSDGTPVIGTLTGSISEARSEVVVSSPGRWSCQGGYTHADFNGTTTQVPLKCDNGATGTGAIVFQKFQANFVMAFSLSSGETGQVTFIYQ